MNRSLSGRVRKMGLEALKAVFGLFWRKYVLCAAASIVALFAIAGPVVIGSAGMALDMGEAYLVRERLSHALDAAALAAAGIAATDEAAANLRLNAFMNANYPAEKLGAAYNVHMSVEGDNVHVTADADYNTAFLWILGIDIITVSAETVVQREVQGLEVVLVLDNTGSMATNNNIGALKTATRNFINILFANTSDPNTIKIGMVPYSNSVRVGPYGLGKNPDGSTYGNGDVFVTLPAEVTATNNHEASSGWYGCVVEHNPNNYNSAATHVSGSKGQLWDAGGFLNGHGWDPAKTTNDPHPDDVNDDWEGPWDIYQYGTVAKGTTCLKSEQQCTKYTTVCLSSHQECKTYYTTGKSKGQCKTYTTVCDQSEQQCSQYSNVCTQYNYTFTANSKPNEGCPYANIVPLTSDQNYLLAQVEPDGAGEPDDMEPHGNTLGNIGMIWGERVLSPEAPFTEAQPWDNKIWRKAIVMMTDGDNTDNATYSSYWFSSKNQMNVTKYNDRFAEVCNALKQKDVVVYTITFTSGITDDTKAYYRNCATTDSKYFDTPTQGELIDTFEQIANELSNLRITQ